MDTAPIIQIMLQFPSFILDVTDALFLKSVMVIWRIFYIPIIIALIINVLLIVTTILAGRPNKMPTFINSYIGKVTYLLFAVIIFFIFYKFQGAQTISKEYFIISGALSIITTKFFLRDVLPVWDY